MSDSLGNKVKILTQLLNQNQTDHSELLITLTKLLEDKDRDQSWNILTARRIILNALDTHHPHVDIGRAFDQWKQDHKDENERHREKNKNQISVPDNTYYT